MIERYGQSAGTPARDGAGAGPIRISNVQALQDGDQDVIEFDIAWNDSWRFPVGSEKEGCWDAAWVFIKQQASLSLEIPIPSGSAHEVVAGLNTGDPRPLLIHGLSHLDQDWIQDSSLGEAARQLARGGRPAAALTVEVSEDGAGAFIHRSAKNSAADPGPVHFQGVQLRVGPLKGNVTNLWVFGLAMVHIPQGAFHLGDPAGLNGPNYCFYDTSPAHAHDQSYRVTSDDEIVLGERLTFERGGGERPSGVIPRTFPKGYRAFYVMRFHVTQGEYADFINTLAGNARTVRFPYGGEGAYRYTVFTTDVPGNTRIALRRERPCNWLSWADGIAYASWAGLRPMTELEFEKACRGPAKPIRDEYAWGTPNIFQAMIIVGQEDGAESISGNATFGAVTLTGGDGGQGPVRDNGFAAPGQRYSEGMFPTSRVQVRHTGSGGEKFTVNPVNTRECTGSSYYGVQGLSGNLWELCVTVGNPEGRQFSGRSGSGVLPRDGNARSDLLGWPGETAVGTGFRGGSWYTASSELRVADRTYAMGLRGCFDRSHDTGFRCARTAPES